MRMFRTFYRATAGVVLLVGLALLPFLDVLMKERPDVDPPDPDLSSLLFKSVASYLLIYKKTLVDAHQMNYITVLYHNGFLVLQDVCQIVILLLTGNFILFLVNRSCLYHRRKYLHVGNGGPAVSLSEGRMQGKAARGGAEGYPEKCEGHVYAQARKCGG